MKKNRNVLIAILALLLAGTGAFFYFNQKKTTYQAGEKDFAVTDTSDVDKIFLADKTGQQTTLTRDEHRNWIVNNKYMARQDMLINLFDAIKRITVRAPVAASATDNILKRMATNNIKVEIYKKGQLHKVYYVGSATTDSYGSFVLMEGAERPYICYLPGHNGYITSFYNPSPLEWRNRIIFAMNPRDIRSVKVEYTYDPSANYTVEQPEKNRFRLLDASGKEIQGFDTIQVKSYLLEFKNIAYEAFVDIPKLQMDSIRNKYNLFTLTLTDNNGKSTWIRGHRIKLAANSVNEFGKEVTWDSDRMYGEISNYGDEYVFLQYITFDRILKTPGYFMQRPR